MSVAHPRLASPSWLRLPRRTARLRLTALYGGLFLLTGAALVAITYVLFERATEYRTPPLPKIPHTPAIGNLQLPFPLAQTLPQQFDLLQNQLAQAQNQLAQAQHQLAGLPAGPFATRDQQLTQDQQQLTQDQHQLAQSVHQLAQSVHQLAQAGTVQAAQRAADAHQLLVNSGIALAIVAVLALLAGWLVAGRMLRPIRTITRTARRISSTSLHERLALDGPEDELKELGDTLDGLFARLEAAFEAQRHFVANASHELRTPLTAERTLLQVALDDPGTTTAAWRSTAQEVLASSDEQARLIEALLTLASSESGLNGHEPVDLATTVPATLAGLEPETGRLGIHIDAGDGTGDPRWRPAARRTARGQPAHQRRPPQRCRRPCRGRDRGEGRQGRPVGDQHRTTHPASGSRPPLPALPAARSAPGNLQGRARARTVHRPGHRDRTRRHHHRPPHARRRPLRERHLPATREPSCIFGTSFPKRPDTASRSSWRHHDSPPRDHCNRTELPQRALPPRAKQRLWLLAVPGR